MNGFSLGPISHCLFAFFGTDFSAAGLDLFTIIFVSPRIQSIRNIVEFTAQAVHSMLFD